MSRGVNSYFENTISSECIRDTGFVREKPN